MKTTSLLILFLFPFLCLAQLKENEKDSKTELKYENTPSENINNSASIKNQILEEKFVSIGGIEQWITIKGEDRTKPVVLFLHGGPGSVLSPYADAIFNDWKKEFILVQWDQRGSGRTFGLNAPIELSPKYFKENPLTVDQMVTDGIELSEYIIKHLGKQKIVILGTSWGSVLGTNMAIKRPDLFYAYIGHSQVVNPTNDLIFDYQKVLKMAQDKHDQKSMDILNSIGIPPYANARNNGRLIRVIKEYEKINSIAPPNKWWILPEKYNNKKDIQHRSLGDDYSFISYIGHKVLGVDSMNSSINFIENGLNFKVPVFIIQGEEDILTPKKITKDYFNKIKAPIKEFFLLPETAHGFNEAVIIVQYKILEEYIIPIIIEK